MSLSIPEAIVHKKRRFLRSRFFLFAVIALLLHLAFTLCIAPLIFLSSSSDKTEVVSISESQLEDLKKKIQQNRERQALLKEEVSEKYKSEKAPEDAQMMAPHNQVVPKEMVAGPQADAPEFGGGGKPRQKSKPEKSTAPDSSEPQDFSQKKISLSNLGLGSKVPKPTNKESEQGASGPESPFQGPGQYRPVGRDDPNLQKGNQNLLNAVENEFYSFFVRLEEPIIRNWYFLMRTWQNQIVSEFQAQKIKPGTDLNVTIELRINRSGDFESIQVVESSNVKTLDWATKEAFRKVGSVPNPPPKLFAQEPYLTRRYRFTFSYENSVGIHIAPESNW